MTERELFLKHMKSIGSANFMFELDEDGNFDDMSMAYAWSAWQASANRQGYKLVPVDNMSMFYQDDNGPEKFCEHESDFDSLGDCTELGEIMVVNKYTNANLKKEVLYGVWVKCEKKPPYFKESEFKLFDSKIKAEQAMIGAVE